jgi:hypothetical protein
MLWHLRKASVSSSASMQCMWFGSYLSGSDDVSATVWQGAAMAQIATCPKPRQAGKRPHACAKKPLGGGVDVGHQRLA